MIFWVKKMTKTTQNILSHLAPVEYGLYHDTYLCGITIENKNLWMYTWLSKVKEWVEKNGGKFVVLSDKVICHRLHKKGFVVQIVFPYGRGDMKCLMGTLFHKNMVRVSLPL